ncbi:hypothetical protein NIES4101_74130 [Calothrix sp. NIES-4101]|nr:hypothetical protein NIES4101_74130 [Calothrix sp. NIES-4101]
MPEIARIYQPDQLSKHRIYDYRGTKYRFICKCPYAQLNHPQWNFDPLPGQRSKKSLRLNLNKIRSGCLVELPDVITKPQSQVPEAVQQSLF